MPKLISLAQHKMTLDGQQVSRSEAWLQIGANYLFVIIIIVIIIIWLIPAGFIIRHAWCTHRLLQSHETVCHGMSHLHFSCAC